MSAGTPGMANSLREMRPSVFRPTSTIAKSFSMATMVPLMTAPSCGLWVSKLCSSMAAKSSRLGGGMELSVGLSLVAARAIQIPAIVHADRMLGIEQLADFPGLPGRVGWKEVGGMPQDAGPP